MASNDLMRATFPAGTVSGAPKIRAMQLIADLEGTTRGPYGGCVSFFQLQRQSGHLHHHPHGAAQFLYSPASAPNGYETQFD